jgi:hypothetical protein
MWQKYYGHLVKFKDPDISADIMDDLLKNCYNCIVSYKFCNMFRVYFICLYISGPCNTA